MGKRVFDMVVASCLVILLAIPMLLLGFLTWLFLGTPIIYRSVRIGLGEEVFVMYKFRTMTEELDDLGRPLSDEQRLTSFGRLVRSFSLDELPELINVMKGDMSLVGPRPLLPEYLKRYSEDQARRHEVRPGITGLAQVRGRNALGWEDRLALDVWYVDNRSMTLDLRILVSTVWHVVSRTGISAADHATMPEFRGTGDE